MNHKKDYAKPVNMPGKKLSKSSKKRGTNSVKRPSYKPSKSLSKKPSAKPSQASRVKGLALYTIKENTQESIREANKNPMKRPKNKLSE